MPERNLRIIHGPNPLFAECEQCHARFTSFSVIPAEADRQVRAAFKEHKCEEHKKPRHVLLVGRKNKARWVSSAGGKFVSLQFDMLSPSNPVRLA
jgi:hypothetical protein